MPVIVSDSRTYGVSLVEKHKVGIVVKDDQWDKLDKLIAGENLSEIKKNIQKARTELSLKNNSHKLVAFYNYILDNFKS